MAKSRLAQRIGSTMSQGEIEYGIKEFVQGILIGFILGFLIALVYASPAI
jgi:F0F1-type ATP synthase assembly protein I